MEKRVNWLSLQTGSTDYHCKRVNWLSWQKGSTGYYSKRGQLAIMAKVGNDYHDKSGQWLSWQKRAMTIMTKAGNDYHDKSGQWLSWRKRLNSYHGNLVSLLAIMEKGSTGYHGIGGQLAIMAKGVNCLAIMAKGVNWLSWQKGQLPGYYGKRVNWLSWQKGSTGHHGKHGQLTIRAKVFFY